MYNIKITKENNLHVHDTSMVQCTAKKAPQAWDLPGTKVWWLHVAIIVLQSFPLMRHTTYRGLVGCNHRIKYFFVMDKSCEVEFHSLLGGQEQVGQEYKK